MTKAVSSTYSLWGIQCHIPCCRGYKLSWPLLAWSFLHHPHHTHKPNLHSDTHPYHSLSISSLGYTYPTHVPVSLAAAVVVNLELTIFRANSTTPSQCLPALLPPSLPSSSPLPRPSAVSRATAAAATSPAGVLSCKLASHRRPPLTNITMTDTEHC
jgi:hypothetical protein